MKFKKGLCTFETTANMAQQPQPIRDVPTNYDNPVMNTPASGDPNALYNPPNMAPRCAFEKRCTPEVSTREEVLAAVDPVGIAVAESVSAADIHASTCIDYTSWGFNSIRQAKYTPNTRYLNQMRCFYFMDHAGVFTHPQQLMLLKDEVDGV